MCVRGNVNKFFMGYCGFLSAKLCIFRQLVFLVFLNHVINIIDNFYALLMCLDCLNYAKDNV